MNQGLEYQHYNFLLLLFFRLIFGRLHQTGVAKVFVAVFAQRVGCDSTDIPADKTDKPRANKAGPTCWTVAPLPALTVRATSPLATYATVPGIMPKKDAGAYSKTETEVNP